MPKVSDLLKRKGSDVASVNENDTVLDAAHIMNDLKIGSVVVTHDEMVVGIFTERDILMRIVAAEKDPATTKVGDVMTRPVAACCPHTSLEECQSVISSKRIRHLPVVDEGRLVGIVTSGDLLAREAKEQAATIEYLYEYLYGKKP
ncbi:CBS domain-containing protein [bacterium]|nr:CBS domain-containing protein [bacterium]